jgi:hypothetical protein
MIAATAIVPLFIALFVALSLAAVAVGWMMLWHLFLKRKEEVRIMLGMADDNDTPAPAQRGGGDRPQSSSR